MNRKTKKINQLLISGRKNLKSKRYNSALEDFMKAQELDKNNPEVHYNLGITFTRMENYEKAIGHFNRVINSELTYINKVHTEMVLGYIYTIKEDYEKALTLFKGIVKAGFENAQAYAALGYLMDRMGNFKEAIMNLYHALEIDPRNANAHNSLGYIYTEANINLEEALKECKKAVSLDRNNPAYLDSLGWVYYKLGKIPQAKSYLNKASKKAPANEEIRNHLRVVMERSESLGLL